VWTETSYDCNPRALKAFEIEAENAYDDGIFVTAAAGNQTSRRADARASTAAPLPVVGLRWMWRLPHNFYVAAKMQYFYIEFDPYKGSLTDLKATVTWQPTDHFGVGLGYNDFGFRFDINSKRDFDGRLRWNYGGALAFATFMF